MPSTLAFAADSLYIAHFRHNGDSNTSRTYDYNHIRHFSPLSKKQQRVHDGTTTNSTTTATKKNN